MDGRLDEPAWSLVPPATEFIQMDPAEGTPATERTEVRILYDDEACTSVRSSTTADG